MTLHGDDRFLPLAYNLYEEPNLSQRPALVIFGANSSGKTSFIQRLLGIGNILPADIGPVTARIVQLSYAPAGKACFRVYTTVEKMEVAFEGDLSPFFLDQTNPDWDSIAKALLSHVQRPSEMNTRSSEFNEWAARFIEVQLPSEVLKSGMDVYDTPGFLSGKREEVLSDNLHALVTRIRPILLFLYENAAIDETERNCFLAMKEALHGLARVPIFFLATKADCISIANDYHLADDPDEVSLEVFQVALAKKRQRCYDLLRHRTEMASEVLGSLPVQVDDCPCFDIFTTGGDLDPWENYTNLIIRTSLQRIVLFAVDSCSVQIRDVSRDALAVVDNYFCLLNATTQRTAEQWGKLGQEALDWGERFFIEYMGLIPMLIDELLERSRGLIEKHKEEIAEQAADLERVGDSLDLLLEDKRKRIGDYIQLAVQEKIIKVAANQVIVEKGNAVKQKLTAHFDQQQGVRRNELLEIAQRQVLKEISAATLTDKSLLFTLLDNLLKIPLALGRFWRSAPTRMSARMKNKFNEAIHKTNIRKDDAVFKLLDAMDTYANLSNKENRRLFAHYCLSETANNLQGQKSQFNSNLTQWLESQHQAFYETMRKTYDYIGAQFPNPWPLHDQLEKHSASFARVECQLLAALHLVEHKGLPPVLRGPLGRGGFYSVHAAEWGTEHNLAVKKLIQPTAEHLEMMALEVHQHRAVTAFENIAPFRYVYEHHPTSDQREFWLIMPRYPMSLQEYLKKNIPTMSFERTISFAVSIAQALSELHRCEFVHRDLKSSNIMLDENEQCFLIDFGTARSGLLNQTVLGTAPLAPEILVASAERANTVHCYDGAAADMYAFGCVLYEIFPKPTYARLEVNTIRRVKDLFRSNTNSDEFTKDYESLTIACLDHNPSKRPRASDLLVKLKLMQAKFELKLCISCRGRDRILRFTPCGHKVLCDGCWQSLTNQGSEPTRCILCKVIVTGETRDNVNATYLRSKK